MNKKPISETQRQQRSDTAKRTKAKQTPEERKAAAKHATSIQWADRAEPPSNAVEIIQEACENGCTHEQIATALGIGRGLLRKWLDKYPDLQAAMTEGRQIEHDKLVGKLFQLAMKGNLTAIIFSLKARFGYREGETPIQNTVSVNFILPKSLSPEEYAAKVAKEALLIPAHDAARLAAKPEVRRELAKDLKPEVKR